MPWGQFLVTWTKPEAKPVAPKSWYHVQVDVKDLLPCGFAMRQQEIDPLTFETTCGERPGDFLRDLKQMGTRLRVKIEKICRMRPWDDEHMAGVDRLDIQEGEGELIFVDFARRCAAFCDLTEDARGHQRNSPASACHQASF